MAFVLAPKMMVGVLLLVVDDPEATPKALLWLDYLSINLYVGLLYWLPVKQTSDNKIAIFVLPATTWSLLLCV